MTIGRIILIALGIIVVLGCCPVARGDGFAQGVSDATGPLAALGVATTFFGSGEHAKNDAARMSDALILAYGTTELLKPNINIDESDHLHSFPSGHTAIAFAAATSLSAIHPKQQWIYYTAAALIGWSRVEVDAHTWGDVLGGAALGYGAGRLSMSSEGGLMIGRVYRF